MVRVQEVGHSSTHQWAQLERKAMGWGLHVQLSPGGVKDPPITNRVKQCA